MIGCPCGYEFGVPDIQCGNCKARKPLITKKEAKKIINDRIAECHAILRLTTTN